MKLTNIEFSSDYSDEILSVEQLSEIEGCFLLEFGAPWCGHCKAAFAAVKELLDDNPHIRHLKIYDGKGKKLGRVFGVKLWPTFIVMKAGKEVARIVRPNHVDEFRKLIQ